MADQAKIVKSWASYRQLFRYALVGVMSNLSGYLVYLLLTYLGGTPKLTMSFLYGISAAVGFYGNRSFTFAHHGSILGSGGRYVISHCIGYLLNLIILVVFVDKLGFAHQWVQGIAIFIVAGFLFLAFKVFVFPVNSEVAR